MQIDEVGNGVLEDLHRGRRAVCRKQLRAYRPQQGKCREYPPRVLGRVLPKYAPCRAAPAPACFDLAGAALETLFIEGHTDATGIDAANWQLSTARAVSTYRQIIAEVPPLRSLRNRHSEEIISVSGYAATRPLDPSNAPQAWDRNRRIDLRFVMETDNRLGLEHILKVTDDMRGEIDRLRKASGAQK